MPQDPQQVVEAQPQSENDGLEGKDMRQVIVFVVLDHQAADPPFTHIQSLHHRDHHPGDCEILSHHFEYLIGLADDDDFMQTFPSVISQRLAQLEFLRRCM